MGNKGVSQICHAGECSLKYRHILPFHHTLCNHKIRRHLVPLQSPFLYLARFAHISGFAAGISGFVVAIKQMEPDQEIKLFAGVSIANKQLPLILMGLNLAFFVLGLPSESLPFSFFGLIISWTYLRFYQKKDQILGDMSDTFSFASFFPELIRPPATILGNIVFNLLVLLRCCNPSSLDSRSTSSAPSADGFDVEAAERRRARALRALDQRLEQMTAAAKTEVPTPEVRAKEIHEIV
eukprot:TRINITY_DN6188_c0_g1_i1.p1 TRINITY_DN6188_c0_g1~~TRINITY_DN6188_c0_g1_i1.p1  ORF type:complete len:238 (+),score=60.49 TRINITY_DN6188_c0_g1_i1:291-1004(+)